jgi:enoyl-CoA hydratase
MQGQRTAEQGHLINDMLEALPFPVIAAINGPALGGGCELSLACDFRVVGEHASFGFPEVSIGIMPGAGGTQRMTRIIGAAKTKEMVLLGKKLNGEEAYALGLATVLVPDDQVQDEAVKMAEQLKTMPAYASAMAKRAINLGETYGLGTGKLFEKELFGLCFAHPDQEEGMDAFMNKRAPHYSNDR